jgi:hypothetical protein
MSQQTTAPPGPVTGLHFWTKVLGSPVALGLISLGLGISAKKLSAIVIGLVLIASATALGWKIEDDHKARRKFPWWLTLMWLAHVGCIEFCLFIAAIAITFS